MDTINFEGFEWFLPEEKNPLAITIPNLNTINFNLKLLPQLPTTFIIGVKENGHELCICEHARGFHPCKSGSVKGISKPIIEKLVAWGVRLPARYTVTKEDGCWIARLDAQALPHIEIKKPSRRPRQKDITGLLQEVNNRCL